MLGVRVAYATKFLRATQDHERAHWRGMVVAPAPYACEPQRYLVRWDNGHETYVLASNLVRADRLHLEPI